MEAVELSSVEKEPPGAELERVREELRQSEARFRDVIEQNADAILVLDRHGTIRFANSQAERLFGNIAGGLRGTSFGYPAVAGQTSELDVTRGGITRLVEMRVVESAWEGEPACIASLRDITERKRAEDAARNLIKEQSARSAAEAAAGRFRFLAESSAALSASLDVDATIEGLAQLCAQELADWTVVYLVEDDGSIRVGAVATGDPAGSNVAARMRDETRTDGQLEPVRSVLRSRRPLIGGGAAGSSHTGDEVQPQLIDAAGIESFMLVPMIARDRGIGAIALLCADPRRHYSRHDLALAEDLALRAALAVDNARLYNTARVANQAKTDYLAVISHDLRTPLNSIIGHADLLSMGIPEKLSDATAERVERIRSSAAHLLRLIDELLIWVRLDTGHEELHIAEVNAEHVVRDVAQVVDLLASERGLDLIVETGNSPVPLETDPAKLHQILLNLVANAVKYTERGHVRISLATDGDSAVFTIMDTGIGIAPENIGRIFEPFWQVDRARRTDGGGTGLGLSVVHRLVQLLGGQVRVESEPGRGSTFTVLLPVSRAR
jgi:signal transduction histidine kinase